MHFVASATVLSDQARLDQLERPRELRLVDRVEAPSHTDLLLRLTVLYTSRGEEKEAEVFGKSYFRIHH